MTVKREKPLQDPENLQELSAESLLQRGDIAFTHMEFRKALMYYRTALGKEPDNVRCLRKVGTTFYKLRELPEAVAHFEKAINLEPKNKDLIYALGLVYIRMNDKTKALNMYDRLKKIHVDKAEEFFKLIYE